MLRWIICGVVSACQAFTNVEHSSAIDAPSANVVVDADTVVKYVNRCRKLNGAFGPLDQEYSDAAWNYPAIRTLQQLGVEVADPEAIVEHGSGSPSGHGGNGHYQFFHHHGIRHALNRKIEPAHRLVEVQYGTSKLGYYSNPLGPSDELQFKAGGRPNPDPLDIGARKFVYHNLTSLYHLLAGLEASNREPSERRPLIEYVQRRQAEAGGYCDVRASDGAPNGDESHIAHTMQAVAVLTLLKGTISRPDDIAAFVHSCRLSDGSYRWNSRSTLPGNDADVYYTWAALRTLKLLNRQPEQVAATLAWLNSLQNADGGFGDRPGWRSRLYSTYYAVEAFALLNADARSGIAVKRLAVPPVEAIADGDFRVFQAQFKMPVIAPGDLKSLRARGFHLLALKSGKFADAEPLLATIREQQLPADVVLCPEAYPHRVKQLGGMVVNHVGNFTLDPRWSSEQRAAWQAADAAGGEGLPWSEYCDRVVRPLEAIGSLVYPEQDYEMEYAYIAYDSNRSTHRGYNAVLVGFNWAPFDFVRVFPWRERYTQRLTPISDVDAHGNLEKWSSHLDTTRHLYIARGPTHADFQEAVAAGRVVCVVVDAPGVRSRVTYYGPDPAVEFVRRHIRDWQWWKP